MGLQHNIAVTRRRRRREIAAVDVALDGKDALTQHAGPFGGGPFQYKPLETGGFELKSRLTVPKKGPVTLTVGTPPKPTGTR